MLRTALTSYSWIRRYRPGANVMRGSRYSAVSAVLAAAAALVLATPAAVQAAAGASARWTLTAIKPPSADSILQSVACTAAGSCVAAGSTYLAADGDYFTVTETDGHWGQPVAGLLPPGTGSSSQAAAGPISCPATGYCVLIAGLVGPPGVGEEFIATEEHGSWVSAFPVTFSAEAVSCAAINRCQVVGVATGSTGRPELMSVSDIGGHWLSPSPIAFSGAAAAAESGGFQSLDCVAKDCVAVGTLNAETSRSSGVAAIESSGRWRRLPALKLPKMRMPKGARKLSDLLSVSCQPSGSCTAVGGYGYTTSTGSVPEYKLTPMIVTLKHGRWSNIVPLTKLPSRVPKAIYLQVTTISCARAFCLAGGLYQHQSGISEWIALRITRGRLTSATRIPFTSLPGNVLPFAEPSAAACAGDGVCAMVGGFNTGTLPAPVVASQR
jgi:hypothetical protein